MHMKSVTLQHDDDFAPHHRVKTHHTKSHKSSLGLWRNSKKCNFQRTTNGKFRRHHSRVRCPAWHMYGAYVHVSCENAHRHTTGYMCILMCVCMCTHTRGHVDARTQRRADGRTTRTVPATRTLHTCFCLNHLFLSKSVAIFSKFLFWFWKLKILAVREIFLRFLLRWFVVENLCWIMRYSWIRAFEIIMLFQILCNELFLFFSFWLLWEYFERFLNINFEI